MSTANQNALFLFKWPFLLTLCGLPPAGTVPLLLVVATGCLRRVNPEMKGRGWGQASVSPESCLGEREGERARLIKASTSPREESPGKGWL